MIYSETSNFGMLIKKLVFFCLLAIVTFGVRTNVCAITVDAAEAELSGETPLYHLTKGTSEELSAIIPAMTIELTDEEGNITYETAEAEITKITNSKPAVASYEEGILTGLTEGTTTIKFTYRYVFSTGVYEFGTNESTGKAIKSKTVSVQIRVVAYSREENTLTLLADQIVDGDIYYSLNEALTEARDNATDEAPYTIRIPAGNYTLSNLLHIYSNTTLEMDPATVISMTATDTTENGKTTVGGNMLLLGTVSGSYQGIDNYNTSEACAGYNGFRNVIIRGGMIAGNAKNTSGLVRMAHATNVIFDGVTFSGGAGKHQLEVAAVDGLTIQNCVFTDFYGSSGNLKLTSEALQLDVTSSEVNYTGAYQDGTTVKNAVITGCTFQNLSKGLGTHSVLVGAYHENISITNNVFSNITYAAISCLNYYNCQITGNVIENCGQGIDFSYYIPTYLAASNCIYTTIFNGAAAYDKKIKHDAKTVISGNTINITYRTSAVGCVGINVYGYNLEASKKGADKKAVMVQDYYVSGVTVADNVITTAGYGIKLSNARKCIVTNNTITGKDFSENDAHIKAGGSYDGIYLVKKSAVSELSGNTIKNMNGGGIYLDNSTASGGIINNTITGVKRYGIYVYSGGKVKVGITGNTIKSTSEAQALIYLNTTATTRHFITGNTLRGYKTNPAIKVDNGKFTIKDNIISRVSDGVVLSDTAAGYIFENTCAAKKASRVRFADKVFYMSGTLQTTIKATKKGEITPELPTIKDIAGYEIRVSETKDFSGDAAVYRYKKTAKSATIQGLTAKKKYYVRAYAYKTYKGVRIYKNA